MSELSINSHGSLLVKSGIRISHFDINKLQVNVNFFGRRYVTGKHIGMDIEIGNINSLVKLLGDSSIKMANREKLYNKIIQLETESNPLINKNIITSLGHKIRHFIGKLLFNREGALEVFQVELNIFRVAAASSFKPKAPQTPIAPKPVVAKPAAVVQPKGPQAPVAAKPSPAPAAFNHKKTAIKDLRQNVLNPFRIDFKGRTKEDQFNEILQYIKDFRLAHPGKQLAITYAANTDQANELYKGYKTGSTPKISGSNQAEVFGLLAEEIKKNKWDNDVHILPIPTCKYVKKVRYVSDMEDVLKAMENIKKHKENKNCFVLATQNETCSADYPLAIGGGGVAGAVWENTPQQKHVHKLAHEWMAPVI